MIETLPAIRRIGPYRLEEQLGAGGMGEVYRAFDERLERPVALKRIRVDTAESPRLRRRFRREARAGARLNHPNIVKVHDILATDDGDWIVMELVEGVTLARILQEGPLGLKRALDLGLQLATALAVAHADGLVHRDLKTKNVLVTTAGSAKVLDFGLVKQILDRGVTSISISIEGQMVGTPHAMSPEQAMGRKVDPRSDLFSLGSLLYELATGKSPFLGASPLDSLTRVCTRHQAPARELSPEVPRELSDLIDGLLEKDPAHRPQTAGEVVLALRRLADAPVAETVADVDGATLHGDMTLAGRETAFARTDRRRSPSERRQLTVMCCELVEAGAGSGSLDAEALYPVMAEFAHQARRAIERFEGHVANALGHRVVAYFGYPQAHEDDARRAVHAALELVARLETSPALAARVGIHTGPAVFLRDDTRQEQVALGHTLDLAIGLQRQAEPGSVVVSPATHHLIAGGFSEEALEPLRDVRRPIAAHRVLEAKDSLSFWEVGDAFGPLVAREQESRLLLDRWRLTKEGQGQVVLLSGEAGIGKSRLVHALRERLQPEVVRWLTFQGSPYAQSSPLHPVIDGVRRALKIDPDDSPARQLTRLERSLDRHGLPLQETVPLLAGLFTIPLPERYPPLTLRPEAQRKRTLEALSRLLAAMTVGRPTVLVVEDLHWMDPSTLELLGLLIETCEHAALFLLLTFRLHFAAPWRPRAHLTQLNLSRLTAREAESLVDRVAGGKALPAEVREQIIAKTDGVPLFVEELTKSVLESELLAEREGRYELVGALEELSLPSTLRDSLTARLDRLGRAKQVAQLAATVGREFSHELLAAVSTLAVTELDQELDRLVDAGLVYGKGFSRRRRYVFKHALIQDAAYATLLKKQQRLYHAQIAEILEERFPRTVETQPELLAHHFTEARRFERGIDYWQRAGERTFRNSAATEATGHLRKGLSFIGRLPENAGRDRRELALQTVLGASLTTTSGFASPDVQRTYNRARTLCEKLEDAQQDFWVVRGLWNFYIARVELRPALELGQRLIRLAEPERDPVEPIAAHMALGATLFVQGEFTAALAVLEEGIAFDDPDRAHHHASRLGQDPGVTNLSVSGRVLWFLGYPEKARRRIEQAAALARRISHRFSLTNALHCLTAMSYNARDPAKVVEHATEVIALSREQGSCYEQVTQTYLDWALCIEDPLPEAPSVDRTETLRRTIEKEVGTGYRHSESLHLIMLAQALARRGSLADARPLLEKAGAAVQEKKEGLYEADVYRLLGELQMAEAGTAPSPARRRRLGEAEENLRRALDTARRRSAKSLELQAAISLGRLWMAAGKKRQARDLLGGLYGWFTEGFDTPDLREARALLAEM